MAESEGAGPEIALDLAIELADWPRGTMEEIRALGSLVRSREDAAVLLRLAYVAAFEAVPEARWREWDELSDLIARGWNRPDYGVQMIRVMKGLARCMSATAAELDRRRAGAAVVGRFAWSLLAVGVLTAALGRRGRELIEESVRVLRANLSDLSEAGAEPGITSNEHGQT